MAWRVKLLWCCYQWNYHRSDPIYTIVAVTSIFWLISSFVNENQIRITVAKIFPHRWKDRWFLVFIKWHLFHFLVGRDSRLLTTDTQWKLILGWQPPQRNNVCTFFIISLYDEEDFFFAKMVFDDGHSFARASSTTNGLWLEWVKNSKVGSECRGT